DTVLIVISPTWILGKSFVAFQFGVTNRPKPHFVSKSCLQYLRRYWCMELIFIGRIHDDITTIHWLCFFYRSIHPTALFIVTLSFAHQFELFCSFLLFS